MIGKRQLRKGVVASIVALLSAGGPPRLYLEIIDANAPSCPVFCVSSKSGRDGSSVDLKLLAVGEVGENGEWKQAIWSLHVPAGSYPIKRFVYGTTPRGWKRGHRAAAVTSGSIVRNRGTFLSLL
jgi:hypothetical protein